MRICIKGPDYISLALVNPATPYLIRHPLLSVVAKFFMLDRQSLLVVYWKYKTYFNRTDV